MKSKDILQAITPPFLWKIGKDLKRRMMRSVDHYSYAPNGWSTPLPAGESSHDYWTTFIPEGRNASKQLISRAISGEPALTLDGDDLQHVIFGYGLVLAGRDQRKISVLDYGGSLGDYYWVGRAFVPWLELEYHCKELATVAEAGRVLNPAVTWHTDDQCLAQPYDLVMFSSSLQYIRDWNDTLSRAARCTRRYLLLSDTPVVRNAASFVATQRSGGVTTLHHQLKRDEIVATAVHAGLRLIREFDMGPYRPVANAPEQPTCIGLLFRRDH